MSSFSFILAYFPAYLTKSTEKSKVQYHSGSGLSINCVVRGDMAGTVKLNKSQLQALIDETKVNGGNTEELEGLLQEVEAEEGQTNQERPRSSRRGNRTELEAEEETMRAPGSGSRRPLSRWAHRPVARGNHSL